MASNTTVSDPVCARKLGHASWGVSVAGMIVSILLIVIVVAVVASQPSPTITSSSSVYVPPSSTCRYTIAGNCYSNRKYQSSVYYCSGHYYNRYCYYN